jgi:hypothetical protein
LALTDVALDDRDRTSPIADVAAHELLVRVARKFPDLTSAELPEALQDATAAAERRIARKH